MGMLDAKTMRAARDNLWAKKISAAEEEREAAKTQKLIFTQNWLKKNAGKNGFSTTEEKTAEITTDVNARINFFNSTPGNQEEGPQCNADTQGELKTVRDLKKTQTHGNNNIVDLQNLTAQKDKKLAQIKTLGNSAADAENERNLFKEIKELRMKI